MYRIDVVTKRGEHKIAFHSNLKEAYRLARDIRRLRQYVSARVSEDNAVIPTPQEEIINRF